MGGAWSSCLPCAGGGTGAAGGTGAGSEAPGIPAGGPLETKKASLQRQISQTVTEIDAEERAPLGDLEEDELDDLDDDDEPEESRKGEGAREGGTQHRLSPRLHDIEEEDDEECRLGGER